MVSSMERSSFPCSWPWTPCSWSYTRSNEVHQVQVGGQQQEKGLWPEWHIGKQGILHPFMLYYWAKILLKADVWSVEGSPASRRCHSSSCSWHWQPSISCWRSPNWPRRSPPEQHWILTHIPNTNLSFFPCWKRCSPCNCEFTGGQQGEASRVWSYFQCS